LGFKEVPEVKLIDIALIAAVAAALFFALRRTIRVRKSGGCGCGCPGCDGGAGCPSRTRKDDTPTTRNTGG